MVTKLDVVFRQLTVFNGIRLDPSPTAAIAYASGSLLVPLSARLLTTGLGDSVPAPLLIIAHPERGTPLEACQRAIEIIETEYFAPRYLSVTSRLSRAISAANRWVWLSNSRSIPQHWQAVSLLCAVAKGETLYLAQAGPATAYLRRGRKLESMNDPAYVAPPAGLIKEIEPRLAAWRVGPGYLLVLASASIADLAGKKELEEALASREPEGILEGFYGLYEASDNPRNFSAIIVRFESLVPVSEKRLLQVSPSPPPIADINVQLVRESRKTAVVRLNPIARSGLLLMRLIAIVLTLILLGLVGSVGLTELTQFLPQKGVVGLFAPVEQVSVEDVATAVANIKDTAAERRMLEEALQLADRKLLSYPKGRESQVALQTLQARWAQLSGMVVITPTKVLEPPSGASASRWERVAVQGDGLYLLDRGSQQIQYYGKVTQDIKVSRSQVVFQAGLRAGDWVSGNPVAMASLPTSSGLLIFDGQGSVFRYELSSGLSPVRINGGAIPSRIASAAAYNSVIYLWSQENLALRLVPSRPEGYWAERYFPEEASSAGFRVLDLAADGNIYALTEGGSILKFYSGVSQLFPAIVPDEPLRRPTAIVAGPLGRGIYVADGGTHRIVHFDAEGRFLRQFRSQGEGSELKDIRAMTLDRDGKQLYFISGGSLYKINLP